ncbi:energy transducer TonB [Pseudotenacibaculum sp. MALMAid0570]|uniref:energy transducer TonB n=1 Tax=Pseudotenacibaculum sp. MALMAid0570 TaxID=3143938 RepID=UPI0032DEE88A
MKKHFKVSIPKPCHEDWSKMTPKEKGRFCNSCSKTVIDFTQKSQEEIQNFLAENNGKRVCGHFQRNQLDTIVLEIPTLTFQQQLSFQKLFILALLFVMGTTLFSCQNSSGKKQKIENVILIDTIEKVIIQTLGELPVTGKTLPPEFNKNFHIDSTIEIEEEEIIIEDVPIIETPEEIEGEVILTTLGDVDFSQEIEEKEEKEDFVLGLVIEEHPRFPEAKNISIEKVREDFNQRIKKFFGEHFQAPQSSIEIPSGKYRIISQFTIDKNGKINNIKIRAPHPSFEKETKRMLTKLPVFIPGKQRGKVVRTRYTLPIRIDVE